MKPSKVSNRSWLFLALAATLGAAVVRFLFIDQGLWADEVQSVEVAKTRLDELLTRTGLLDVHPPLYYLLLKGWNELGGATDLWARLFSLTVGSLTVGVFLLWARRHLKGLALVFSVGLLALSTWHIHYSLEVRSYALLTLLVLLLCWQVECWLESAQTSGRTILSITLLTTSIGLTHYYGLFCLVGVNIFVLTHQHIQAHKLKTWAASQAAAIGCFAWWLPFFFVQAFDLPEGFTSHLQNGPDFTELLSAFGPAAASPPELAIIAGAAVLLLALWGLITPNSNATPGSQTNEAPTLLIRWAVVVASLGLLLAAVAPVLIPETALKTGHPVLDVYMAHGFEIASNRVPWAIALVALCWLGLFGATRLPTNFRCHKQASAASFIVGTVIVIGGILHLMKPSLSTRNLLVLLPMVALLAGRALMSLKTSAIAVVTAATVILSGLSLAQATERFTPRADLKGVAQLIAQQAGDERPHVFVISAFDNGALQHYLNPIPSQGIMNPKALGKLSPRPLYVLLTREAWEANPQFKEAFIAHLGRRFEFTESQTFREVELLVFKPLKSLQESESTPPGLRSVPPRK